MNESVSLPLRSSSEKGRHAWPERDYVAVQKAVLRGSVSSNRYTTKRDEVLAGISASLFADRAIAEHSNQPLSSLLALQIIQR